MGALSRNIRACMPFTLNEACGMEGSESVVSCKETIYHQGEARQRRIFLWKKEEKNLELSRPDRDRIPVRN
jgi:hypothetical protein